MTSRLRRLAGLSGAATVLLVAGSGIGPATAAAFPVTHVQVGRLPIGVAVAGASGQVALVANLNAQTLSVLDTASGTELETIDLLVSAPDPNFVVSAPGSSLAYVSNQGPIAIVDVAAGAVTGSIPDSDGTFDLAIAPDGQRIYGNSGGGPDVGVWTPDGTSVKVLNFGPESPGAMATSPDGAVLYVGTTSQPDANDDVTWHLVAIDTTTWATLRRVDIPVNTTSVAVSPDGQSVWVANSLDYHEIVPKFGSTVQVYDAALRLRNTVTVGAYPSSISLSPDGRTAYVVNNESSTVSVLDTATSTVTQTVPVRSHPTAGALSVDGATLFVTESGFGARPGNSVAIIDVRVAPTVTEQPTGQAVRLGQSATFTAAATGTPTPQVQWQRSVDGTTWTDIDGATVGTLTVTPAAEGTSFLRAVFTNSSGSTTTTAATLAALPRPAVEPTPPPVAGTPTSSSAPPVPSYGRPTTVSLAATGVDVRPASLTGAALVAVGCGLLAATRRREARSSRRPRLTGRPRT